MWLFTETGFFSIVQKKGEKNLTIRSRAAKDLEQLRDNHLPGMGAIIKGGGTDYPYRATASHDDVADALSKISKEIHYDNFKNTIAQKLGHQRAAVYGGVWEVLLAIEKEEACSRNINFVSS